MKKLALATIIGLALFPTLTFAATDDQIKASLTQQLLSMFVVEVNSLDKIQSLVSQSSNPTQFDNFSALVASQLSQTTSQLANLLQATSTVALSSPNGNTINMSENTGGTTVPLTINLFTLKWEEGLQDYYYAGDKELASSSVDGVSATIVTNRHLTDCLNLWDMPGGDRIGKVCGYYMARFTAPQGTNITLIATDGSTITSTGADISSYTGSSSVFNQ